MPKHFVNLDALIVREDLYIKPQTIQPAPTGESIKIPELEERSITYKSLRKPDFQRETASWEPEKIVDLVECFLRGDFVPSLILWFSQDGKTFVIDGAHRLSALIAWVHNDYGDMALSNAFFKNQIPPEQRKIAEKTRKLMRERVGTYLEVSNRLSDSNASDEQKKFARNAGALGLKIQWVVGTPETAENSFKKINQKATPIDPTEFEMICSRKKPNAIVARALIRAGVGHEYWSSLPPPAQEELKRGAKKIYDMLFVPPLEKPIKTLDLPVAGCGYSAESVRLIFDFVNLANGAFLKQPTGKGKQTKLPEIPDDKDGTATLEYLGRVTAIICRITGHTGGSLGLHPAVYFYSATGRYQPTAFLAAVSLIMEMEAANKLLWFTQYRNKFEDFLIAHRYFINQIVNQFGSGIKAEKWVLKLYNEILTMLAEGKDSEIVSHLVASKDWRLKELTESSGNFSSSAKSAVFLRDAVAHSVPCGICGARIHKNGVSIDHIKRKADGGSNDIINGQLAHPFCNSVYKEYYHAKGITIPLS